MLLKCNAGWHAPERPHLLHHRMQASLFFPRYAALVGGLEEASRDNLDFLKDKALRALADLLRAKPEAEARLLAALVNKLGDPSRKLASKARPAAGHRPWFEWVAEKVEAVACTSHASSMCGVRNGRTSLASTRMRIVRHDGRGRACIHALLCTYRLGFGAAPGSSSAHLRRRGTCWRACWRRTRA